MSRRATPKGQAWPADAARRVLNASTMVVVVPETPEAIERANEIAGSKWDFMLAAARQRAGLLRQLPLAD